MKKQFVLGVTCMLLLPAIQSIPAYANQKLLVMEKIDRATGQTQLYTKKLHFGMFPSTDMQAVYSYVNKSSGATVAYPNYVLLKTTKWTHDEYSNTLPNMELTLNVDGITTSLGKPISYQTQHWQRFVLQEMATYQIPLETFQKIISATTVQGHLGDMPIPFPRAAQFQSWKELSSKIDTFVGKTTTSDVEL